jgi:hypothetical protein
VGAGDAFLAALMWALRVKSPRRRFWKMPVAWPGGLTRGSLPVLPNEIKAMFR